MSHESIVNQKIKCKQNLPFEVIAVPQYDDSQLVNSVENNLTDTVNVKIRIRNREETGKKHGIISVPKSSTNSGRKLRLIKSDQTIMSFDFYVEPDKTRKHQKKSHKNIFHIFKPGGCLKTQEDNDDEYHYSPSCFTDVRDIKGPSDITNDQMNIVSEKITLKKNFPLITPTNITTRTAGNFMGKCKPGGCLDPPFNEDKYSYEPDIATSNTNHNKQIEANRHDLIRKTTIDSLNMLNNIKEISKSIVETQLDDDLYQENYSQSLITYPTTSSDSLQVFKQSYDTKVKKRISSEDKARISINEFSEIYFMPPKKDKANKLEKKASLNISDNKNSVHSSISHRPLESPTPITGTAISANNNILDELNSVSPTKCSSINETNADVEISHEILEDVKPPQFRQSIQIPVLKSYSIEYLGYNITSNESSKINLSDTDESKKKSKNLFENKKKYSQKEVSSNKSSTDSMIQIEATDELILRNRQELLVKESVETGQVDAINQLKNKDIKTNTNNVTDHKADPEKKITDEANSVRLSRESFKIVCESEKLADTKKIKVPYLKSEHMQNIDSYHDVSYVLPKHSKCSIKESQELITEKFGEIAKTDDVKTTLNKSEEIEDKDNINIDSTSDTVVQAIEFKSSKKISQETLSKTFVKIFDENEVIKSFTTSLEIEKVETNTNNAFTELEETALDSVMSKDHDNRYFENRLKPNSFPNSISIPFEKQESTDILTTEEVDYAATKLNLENKNFTDISMVSDDSTLNESVTITPTETLTSKISDVKLSSISSMQDRTHKTNFEENTAIGLQDLDQEKYEYLSESLSSPFGLEKGIEVDRNKDFDELVISETSIEHNISHVITNQITELEDKTSSVISRAVENIDDKYKYDLNATYDYYMEDTKQPLLVSTMFLDENSIKSQRSIDRVGEKRDNSCIEQPSSEDNLDISSYSSITIDFGFRCSVNKDNKLEIHTFDTSIPSYKYEKMKVNVIKSIIRVNDDEIRIPINFDVDLTMQIKKAKVMNEDIISKKKSTLEQHFTERSSDETINKDYLLHETLNSVYENLIPLNKIIQTLKEEANTLSRQQNSFKEISESMETKPKRLVHTDPLCGCQKKY